ncbi:hypothetical protein P168DRAFT_278731 [Aspergillus campestris IBT 28561]|uniref:MJ1316 RNA cyclic group end recognition domain-containing protein n=1 Tax=Aspergillus campestris (strain IBT 28561) TaxID=1392248 RepID=A0A2I1DH88_ASPC2|nr:uncharacterized protein P168DRAFT_278731 [Aspergillus campestris IBT 28561]PKY09229.1 hypothetical protein P168DRAFT_278731 [Aspergillus campestris IBT 28561]
MASEQHLEVPGSEQIEYRPSESSPQERSPQESSSPRRTPSPASRSPKSTGYTSPAKENKLRPVSDVINRLIWDENYDNDDYIIGYEDRFEGRLELGLGSWKRETTDEEFIPQHRIIYIKRISDGDVVWDKRRRVDKVFLSGNSAFDYLAFLT